VVLAPYIGFGGAFIASPLLVGALGLVVERFLLRRFYRGDPIYGLLLTFGLAMVAEQTLRMVFGASPLPFAIPDSLRGQVSSASSSTRSTAHGARRFRRCACSALWLLLTRTYFGRVVRAGVQDPDMVGALGISLKPYMTAVVVIAVGLRRRWRA
jgi:branched-chain amino acid transport system permease protein